MFCTEIIKMNEKMLSKRFQTFKQRHDNQHKNTLCSYAGHLLLFIVMLNVVMLSVVGRLSKFVALLG
jgi:hypothetical protein